MANLTKRSLFPIGDGGFAITIPKPWCTCCNLKPKDKIVAISNGFLVLWPEKVALDEKSLTDAIKDWVRRRRE